MDIKISNTANLQSQFGSFKIQLFQEEIKEHLVIYSKHFGDITLVRIHSECLTSNAIGEIT